MGLAVIRMWCRLSRRRVEKIFQFLSCGGTCDFSHPQTGVPALRAEAGASNRGSASGLFLTLLLLLLAVGGCTTQHKPVTTYLFYPPSPDEPRMQYLTGFSSDSKLFERSRWQTFLVGKPKQEMSVGKPYGIGTRRNEIFFCDTGFSGVGIVRLDKGGMEYFAPRGESQMRSPINAGMDVRGNLYVTDTESGLVLTYGPDRAPLKPIGRKDEMKPCGLAIVGDDLYLTDLKNHQVRIYHLPDRTLLRTLPRSDDDGKGKLYSPANVAVDGKGRVYVSDPGAFCVQVYDADGKYVRTQGRQGVGPGQFARPRGLAVDHEGRLYVVDAATQVVQLFDQEGRLLMFFGNPSGSGPGVTSLPAGIAVDYDNVGYFEKFVAPGRKLEYVVFLTNQYGDQKISVYGFLQKP